MLRREDSDQLLTSISHIAQIQQREEALMDVTEVEELLLNCLGPKPAAKTSINYNASSREERGSISSAQRDAITVSSSFTATALLERKGHVEKDIFQDGELEDLMKACSDEEIEEILCDTQDDSRNSDQLLNTLPPQSEDYQPQDLNIQDLCDEEVSEYMSSSSYKYIKNWQVKVFSLPIDDPLRKILKICDYWIVLEGNTADQSGNIIEKELLTTSTWVVRVLTENCIQAVDGSIYTLLGGMDILSTCLSDSSFDSGIFEMGFGEDDHKWKERVLQIIGQDTTDKNNDSISHIIHSDLMTLYQKEFASKGDNISLENKTVEAELLSCSIQEANDVVHEDHNALHSTKILNSSILTSESPEIQKDSRKKVDYREKKRDSSQDSFPLNENQSVVCTIRKDSSALKSSEKHFKKEAAPSEPVPTKMKNGLKRERGAISITKSAKKNRRVSFSDEIMVMEEPKVNPHTPLPAKKQKASPKKNRYNNEIMTMEEPKANLHTPSPAKKQRASNSRSPTSALFNSLESPDCLVSRSGRMSKKPSEWWKVKTNLIRDHLSNLIIGALNCACCTTCANDSMRLLKRKVLTTQNQFPISKVKTENDSEIVNESSGDSKMTYQLTRSFKVLFRKPQAKKHKSWDGDGTLIVSQSRNGTLLNDDGKEVGKMSGLSNEHLNGSLIFMIAGRECEVQSEISNSSNSNENIPLQKTTERLSNGNEAVSYYRIMYRKPQSKMHKSFDGDGYLSVNSQDKCWILLNEKGEELGRSTNVSGVIPNSGSEFKLGGKEVELVSNVVVPYETYQKEISHCLNRKIITPKLQSSTYQKPFKSLKSGTLPPLQPKFDPSKENALIMPEGDQDIVQVVVDPYISVKLKQFQREGVQFLYQCLMNHKSSIYSGCVLADEMGLGKTIQTITVLWTLLKQNPTNRISVAKKALIVCPASLVMNWVKEFKKWLGDMRVRVIAVKNEFTAADFSQLHDVLIINYEKVKKFKTELLKVNYDIIVCDEGHRLKNSANQALQVLSELYSKKRILLSGTPVQNDLIEFFSMFDFVNPGMLGSLSEYKKRFVNSINDARTSDATSLMSIEGHQKLDELLKLVSPFMLRRTFEENSKFLPPKQEFIIFSELSPHQTFLYQTQLNEISDDSEMLSKIISLRKICNLGKKDDPFDENPKFAAIAKLLNEIKKLNEKVILCSHWTIHLDRFEEFIKSKNWQYLRLDGSVGTSKRNQIVESFNNNHKFFSLLLSSKAGGVGLNLIGASRLIMVDIDWNPAIDQQAIARIWRHGQKLPVFIYRFLALGTIEECMYQRQEFKKQLSDSVIENSDMQDCSTPKFSKSELKQITTLSKVCLTHNYLCGGLSLSCDNKNHIMKPFDSKIQDNYFDLALDAVVKYEESIAFILSLE